MAWILNNRTNDAKRTAKIFNEECSSLFVRKWLKIAMAIPQNCGVKYLSLDGPVL